MIIELAPAFAGFSEQDWAPYHGAVENLITAHGQGWHLFAPSRDIASSIMRSCTLSRTQHDIFVHYINARASVLNGQARAAKLTILATVDGQEGFTVRANQIGVPLRMFADLASCSPSKLITENSSVDGRLLEVLAAIMARELGYGAPIQFEHVHGGGGTTANCYGMACLSARPALCIVDSDRKYFGAAIGETARQVTLLDGHEQHPTVRFFVLPVRELENAIPLSVLLDVYSDNADVKNKISSLINYANRRVVEGFADDDNVLVFFDFKSGIRRCDIARIPVTQRLGFVRFAQIVSSTHRTYTDYDDLLDETCVYPGISESVLIQFLDYVEKHAYLRRNIISKIKKSPAWTWLENLFTIICHTVLRGKNCRYAKAIII